MPGAQIGRARRLILGVVALEPASSKPGRACELARASIFRVSEAEVEGLRNLFSAQPRCTIARWSTRRRQLSLGAFFVARLRADRSDGLGWAECASEHTARGSVSTPRIWQHPYPGHSWCLVDSRGGAGSSVRSGAVAGGSAASANGRVQAQTTGRPASLDCSRLFIVGRFVSWPLVEQQSSREAARPGRNDGRKTKTRSLAVFGGRGRASSGNSCRRPSWRGASRQS